MSQTHIAIWVILSVSRLFPQDAESMLQGLQPMAQPSVTGTLGASEVLPSRPNLNAFGPTQESQSNTPEDRAVEQQIKDLKAKEKGPKRFAADLFNIRQKGSFATDGGVSDEYVLGAGDQLDINAFGSASFEVPVKVDGRGMVVIPKLGPVKVGGLSLGRARESIQVKVRKQFANATVDVQAIKLREVRVFLMGEVYKPGSYLVPSHSSLVNVLSLAGGPNAAGSYRQIKVIRGGKIVHVLDLYPIRAEGFGSINFYLENGDSIFVPLALNEILLEGAFTRLVAAAENDPTLDPEGQVPGESSVARDLRRNIEKLESILSSAKEPPTQKPLASTHASVPGASISDKYSNQELTASERLAMQGQLDRMKSRLETLKFKSRHDLRIDESESPVDGFMGQPAWLTRWERDGLAPTMKFEMLPGETASDALRFAGGFDIQAFAGRLGLRRMNDSGAWNTSEISVETGRPSPELLRGDILTALPRRDRTENVVQIVGWVRSPGSFGRKDGLCVGDLLRRESEILPDTYMARGEITRVSIDGTTRYLAFDVSKAMAGEVSNNLLLEDRDRIELYRVDDLRLRKTLSILGPVKRPGTYEFQDGMRAADLLFRAGVPSRQADPWVAELTHFRDGKKLQVIRLDLAKLLSTETYSPVELRDNGINPLLEPFDVLSIYSTPDFKPTRAITLTGQVQRPGIYTIESSQTKLKDIVARAGGLTSDAMPKAAIFLRKMSESSPEISKASQDSGVDEQDPTSNGINEILKRLNETMRNPLQGGLQYSPILHGLQSGSLNRLIVNVPALLAGDSRTSLELQDGDEIIFPKKTEAAYVVGETASPFAVYKVDSGMTVGDMIRRAGGTTRNADRGSIRLLKADGQILDTWVSHRKVEPGDTVIVPQRIRKDVAWQENLAALTPLAIMINALKK